MSKLTNVLDKIYIVGLAAAIAAAASIAAGSIRLHYPPQKIFYTGFYTKFYLQLFVIAGGLVIFATTYKNKMVRGWAKIPNAYLRYLQYCSEQLLVPFMHYLFSRA